MPLTNNIQRIGYDVASANLSRFIERMAASTTTATGVHPFPTADAPNTWEDLQAFGANLNLGYLPVWNGASDSTIYDTPAANVAFRFWHDMGHLDHDCSFTPEDERRLQSDYHLPIVAREFGSDSLEFALYYADTVGQIEYVTRNGDFPTDQRSFCIDYVLDSARALSAIY